MKRILILFAHPALQRSRVNRRLLKSTQGIENVTLHDLYEAYPDMHIDVDREQALLVNHDIIIMQHPFYWYSTPAILKEWQDMVLQHGWAYGKEGRKLSGKVMFNTITTGGPEKAYTAKGYNHFTLRQLLAPLEQTAGLCRMKYLPPFVIHGTHLLPEKELESHANDYEELLVGLTKELVDIEKTMGLTQLNQSLTQNRKG